MPATKVYIILLNYLHWQDTKECLESVLKSSYNDYSVLVIDNDSRNNSLEQLIDWVVNSASSSLDVLLPGKTTSYKIVSPEMLSTTIDWQDLPMLTFIQNEKNTGFAGGNNLVLEKLSSLDGYVWLLNPDMIIQEDTLTELVNFANRQTANCIIGAEVRSYTYRQDLLFYGGGHINFLSGTIKMAKKRELISRLDYISGACLFTPAVNFKKIGLLPEIYFLYWEETDWCYRAKQEGLSLLVCTTAICYDKISTVIGKGFLANYYYSRNGLLFISTFHKKNIPIALLLMKLRWCKRIITGQWKRAGGIWKGTIDFLKKNFHEIQ